MHKIPFRFIEILACNQKYIFFLYLLAFDCLFNLFLIFLCKWFFLAHTSNHLYANE